MNIIKKILSGIGALSFLILVFLILDTFGMFGSPYKKAYVKEPIQIDSGFEVIDQNIQHNSDRLLVSGYMKNIGKDDWHRVDIQLELTSKEKLLKRCSCSIGDFRVGETRAYKFICSGNIPDKDVSADVKAVSGVKADR